MPLFLVESYLPRSMGAHEAAPGLARRAAELAGSEGIDLRYLRTTLLPSDETCFHLYEAGSPESVLEVSRRAAIPVERVVEAIDIELGELKGG